MFGDNAQQCFAFTPQANFPAHNLNFHWRWRWWDWIQAIFLNIFYFKWSAWKRATKLTNKRYFTNLKVFGDFFFRTDSNNIKLTWKKNTFLNTYFKICERGMKKSYSSFLFRGQSFQNVHTESPILNGLSYRALHVHHFFLKVHRSNKKQWRGMKTYNHVKTSCSLICKGRKK